MASLENIQQVNPETGEISEVLLKLAPYYSENDMVIMADVHDGIVETHDIKIFPRRKYQRNEDKDYSHIPEELLEGGMESAKSTKRFAKVFEVEDPQFTKATYYKYWYRVCKNLSRDTNIIVSRKPKKHFIADVREFEQICGTSKFVNYRFIKECKNKGVIAIFELKAQKVFVANPKYVLNGNEFPILLANLFNELEKE
jgi:hypothetical protein